MKQDRSILMAHFFLALLATAFCVWSGLGNDVNFCVTTGCTLYEDFTFFGISLWWYGTAAFAALALLALFGLVGVGAAFAGLCVLIDIGFLALMAITAPCVSCLVAAAFFALIYYFFRKSAYDRGRQRNDNPIPRSILLLVWLAFFVINLGAVAKSQFDVWPILDEGGEANTRMFFSPTCRHCVEGINALSGNIGIAFYPVAENDDDVYRIAKMQDLLGEGMSMAEALAQSQEYEKPGFFGQFSPALFALRFHLICNKAHIFGANSRGVPFFEEKGLPRGIRAKVKEREKKTSIPGLPQSGNRDATLPIDEGSGMQCAPGMNCP